MKATKCCRSRPRLGTVLSNFEANLNYKEVQDPALTVRFAVEGEENTYFVAWTTTPWTLPSNLALAVGPEIDYVKVRDHSDGLRYILAESRLKVVFPQARNLHHRGPLQRERFSGASSIRRSCLILPTQKRLGAFRVIPGGLRHD